MTKNLNKALEKMNYNANEIEQEIEMLEEFCLKHRQVVFSTFTLEKLIASEICYNQFKYNNPSEAIREENQNNFIQLLKDTNIVSKSFQIPTITHYSDSDDSDYFDNYDYLSKLQEKFNHHVHKSVPDIDFSQLIVIKNLFKDYLKARAYYKEKKPKNNLISEPTLKEFAETIKNYSYFNFKENLFFSP